ncbi:MAG: hypothetical protein ACLFQ9_06835 [Desulfobacterales bacterium]
MARSYRLKAKCPQCGCSAVMHLSHEEIQERFGDVPNAELECAQCMEKYEVAMKDACPEWDQECKQMR